MSAYLFKAICRDFQDAVGGNAAAAKIAGVSPSVWSGYCNFNDEKCNIPAFRALKIDEAMGHSWFGEAFVRSPSPPEADAVDPRVSISGVVHHASAAISGAATAMADNHLSRAEGLPLIQDLQSAMEACRKAIGDLEARMVRDGAPHLKPVA